MRCRHTDDQLRPTCPPQLGQTPCSECGERRCGVTICLTPKQVCPRPKGLGRNLRSKTRWFTGFCNSHQVSHFATFFIDARAEISVAESRTGFLSVRRVPPSPIGKRMPQSKLSKFLGACCAEIWFVVARHVLSTAQACRPITRVHKFALVCLVLIGHQQ